jgi:hypothetical protein
MSCTYMGLDKERGYVTEKKMKWNIKKHVDMLT